MYNYIILRLGLFLILNRNILSDASCSLPTDIKNSAWEYNYTKVSDNSPQSTILRVSTTTLKNSIINLNVVGTTIRDWTCINSLALSNTQTLVLFKSDTSFTNGPFAGNRWLYLCMKFTKVTTDLYYFYLLSDISTAVTPNERVFVSEEGNPPANDAPMCSTFCKYTGLPKIRTLRRQGTSDTVPGDAALCEPCDSTCEVDRCDPNPCQNNGSCTDFKENYNCTCTDGWKGENCTTDINECSNKKRATVCPLHSDCFNTVGSYGCNCKNGYQDKNGDCTDVNECERKPCPEHSNCTNTIGSFMCTCWIGYVNTSMGCQDINECSNKKRATVCPLHSDCFNTVGSYGCNCKNGYQDKNGDCTDVNECERKPCPEHSNCTNTIGSFMCTCWIGYVNTSMGCQEGKESNKEKLKDSDSDKSFPAWGTVLLVLIGVLVFVVIVVFIVLRIKKRKSRFEVTKNNSNNRPDAHKGQDNEPEEVEQNRVVHVVKTESDDRKKSQELDDNTLKDGLETVDEQNAVNCDTV